MRFTPENKAAFDRIVSRYPGEALGAPARAAHGAGPGGLHQLGGHRVPGLAAGADAGAGPRHRDLLHDVPLPPRGPAPHRGLHQPLLRAGGRGRAHRRSCATGWASRRAAPPRTASSPCTARSAWPPAAAPPRSRWTGAGWSTRPPTDVEAIVSGALRERPFDWPKSAGEMILLRNVFKEDSASLETYRKGGGYAKLKDFLAMKPEDIIEALKKANLRGRGGAGFPTGLKWGFLPKNDQPRYLCVNADEGEPGTYKDRLILERDPHQLLESCIVSSYAINCKTCYIYIRGEFFEGIRVMQKAIDEAYAAGLLGQGHPRHRRRPRDHAPQRRRVLRVRRGDGAHREPGGQARPAAREAAVPGGVRPLQLPHGGEQRRDPDLRAPDPRARGGVVRGPGHGEERRPQAVLHQRSGEAARACTRRGWGRSRSASSSSTSASRAACPTGASCAA